MWSLGHYLFLISPFLVTISYYFLFRNKTYKQKRLIGIITSIIMILLLVLRNIEIYVRQGYAYNHELIPLQICHFANFVLLYAFIKDSKSVFGFALMFNLPAAFLSILFADGLENYDTILTFRGIAYIFGHMLIVSTTLWAFIEKFAVLNKKTYENTLSITFVLFVLSVFVNNIFRIFNLGQSNFFYSFKPQNGTPLETFFLWGSNITIGDQFIINPIYLIMMVLTGIVLISSMYSLFKGIEKVSARQLSLNTVSINIH
jgi:hypothetical protein